RLGEAPGSLADDARVRRGSGELGPPTDRDRTLRQLERGQAQGRPRAAPVRDEGGAARAAARARSRARAHPHGAGHRGAPRSDALEVALLAHVRLARECAARGRVRRAGGGGEAGAGARTAGRGFSSKFRSGLKRSRPNSRPSAATMTVPSGISRVRSLSRRKRSTTSRAALVEAKKNSSRAVPIQSGRPTPRARKIVS